MKKSKGRNNGLLPNSLRIISSCLKTVSSNASTVATTVRSAGASVAASVSASSEDHKDQVLLSFLARVPFPTVELAFVADERFLFCLVGDLFVWGVF